MRSLSAYAAQRPAPFLTMRKRLQTTTWSLLVSAALMLGHASGSQAKDDNLHGLTTDETKAAHVYKFKKYVTWPPEVLSDEAPIVIGVASSDAIVNTLQSLAAKRDPAKRDVVIRKLQSGEPLAGVHVLYIGNDRALELNYWLAKAYGKPILCVTDSPTMPQGSMINFVIDEDRVRFDVSLTAAEVSQIKLSAALLTVARQVYGGNP